MGLPSKNWFKQQKTKQKKGGLNQLSIDGGFLGLTSVILGRFSMRRV